jgi:ribosomal protein L11 methylase PrmA
LWDVGANVGAFSRIAASLGFNVVAFDSDEGAVERNYVSSKAAGQPGLLPLVADLANPSPGTGWEGVEHAALLDRGPAEAVMALAVIHHLAVGANVPLGQLAALFRRCGRHLLLEFVPKEDPQVSGMLAYREDCFPEYSEKGFESAFGEHFKVLRRDPLPNSHRILYALEAHGNP